MKAIVGLGNPGREYAGTRHNVGFEVTEELARRWNLRMKAWKGVARAAVSRDHDVVLAEPTTFMNLSGQAVQAIAGYYKVEPADVLVIVDEVHLPIGRLRLRGSGSAGGHNGLRSIIQHLGPEFSRLRIGVERGDPRRDLSDRVLSKFPPDERVLIDRAVARAADAAETFVADGLPAAMNRFNAQDDTTTEESNAG